MSIRWVSGSVAIFWLIALTASSQPYGSFDSGLAHNISANVTINGSDNDRTDFGFYIPKGTIGGVVWNDTPKDPIIKEGNGILEDGEEGLKGINVSLLKEGTGETLGVIPSNDTGRYVFEVPYGRYRVAVGEGQYAGEELQGKPCIKFMDFWWHPTTDYAQIVVIDISNPENATINFGLQLIE